MKALLLEDTEKFKKGDLVENVQFQKDKIVLGNKEIISYNNNILLLKENLSSSEVAEVKKIIKDMLKLVFWRLYTRNSFVLQ